MSALVASAIAPYLSVGQLDSLIVGGLGFSLWWCLPSRRPDPPKAGQRERVEGLLDRFEALVAGLVLAVLINTRLYLTPYVYNFEWRAAPLIHTYKWSLPVVACVLYVVWLHVLVPLYRKSNKKSAVAKPAASDAAAVKSSAPTDRFSGMDRLVQVWNLFLSAGSLVMLVGLVERFINFSFETNFDFEESICDTAGKRWNGPGFFMLYVFQLSKFFELFDTVLLVVRNKPVMLLHWYHHTTVLLYCWGAINVRYAPGWWFGTVNCAVHTIMYWYYYRAACGVRLGYDKLITTIQLIQMAVGIFVTLVWWYYYATSDAVAGLGAPDQVYTIIGASVGMYASYLVLFAAFYVGRYCKPKLTPQSRNGAAVSVTNPKAVKDDD